MATRAGKVNCLFALVVLLGITEETCGRRINRRDPKGCLDVAIVGAGIGGTYTAWKLRNSGLKVGIFENTDRIGGRIYSMFLDSAPNVPVELGAMRYEPDVHNTLVELIDTLGLEHQEFLGFSFKKRYYFRGKRLSFEDLLTEKLPFNLAPGESKDPDVLSWELLKKAMNTSDPRSVEDFESDVSVEGKPLYKHGFLDLMDDIWSNEAREYLKTFSPYYSHYENNNFVDSIAPISPEEWAKKPATRTLKGGMNSLPLRLAKEFVDASDNHDIFLNRRLDAIRRIEELKPTYKLRVYRTVTDGGVTKDDGSSPMTVCAKNVILACPRTAHRKINWDPLQENPEIQNIFDSVTDNSAMKIFLTYPSAWWDNLPINDQSFVSDVPLRQTLEMARFQNSTGHENALMLVSYLDGETEVDSWVELRKYAGSVSSDSVPAANRVSNEIVKHVHHHLGILYDVTPDAIPQPLDGTMVIWRGGDYGGAWEYFKPGFKPSSIRKDIQRPSAEDNVFIVTNSYTPEYTYWSEGTLRAVDEVLKAHLSHLYM